MNPGTVLVDTREQLPWWLPGDHDEFGFQFEVRRVALRSGDYALRGLEDRLLIERKASVTELAGCIGFGRPRFERQLQRMHDEAESSLLIIEESPIAVDLWRYKGNVNPAAIFGSLSSWSWRYGIHVYWAAARSIAREVAPRTLAAVAKDPERLRCRAEQGVA